MRNRARNSRANEGALRRAPPRAAKATATTDALCAPTKFSSGRLTRRTPRRTNQIVNYFEDSEEDEDADNEVDDEVDEGSSDGDLEVTLSRRRKQPSESDPAAAPKRQRRYRKVAGRQFDHDELGDENDDPDHRLSTAKATPRKSRHTIKKPPSKPVNARPAPDDFIPNISGLVPPWESLPYMLLVEILRYASFPLCDDQSVRWLVAAGRTCRAFAEPAVTVLYAAPPLTTPTKVYSLTALLARSPLATMFNYRHKVARLAIDVGRIVIRPSDLKDLVMHCPRLTELDICHYKDESPYRQLDDNLRFLYPTSLFEGLGVPTAGAGASSGLSVTRLKSWRWSRRMMGKDLSLADMRTLHLSPTFAGLTKIAFVNYQRPSLKAKDADAPEVIAADRRYAEEFAGLLQVLPDLQHLVMESSTAANEILLPLLPKTLQRLELINCWDVTAETFAEYLTTHGKSLRELTLHHNQSLSLAFLPILGTSCPNLAALRMNLTYFSHHEFYNDSNPLYERLLEADQVPSWPSSIQVIELEHLRQWEAEAAEVFFQSLMDSAQRLPMLRHLAVKAILDIPWRQRSEMRDKWESRMKRMFKRQWKDPMPLRSLAHAEETETVPHKKPHATAASPSRRSGRIASLPSRSSSRASSVARDGRMAGGGRFSYREVDTDDECGDSGADDLSEAEEAGEEDSGPARSAKFVQGLCDIVDIRFDNQKPMETQYGMEDFLDSDNANSDEEWTGDDNRTGGSGYAW